MRIIAFCALAALGAGASAAAAQPPSHELWRSPWWMRDAVIGSIGYVQAEAPSNRAQFSATFQSVSRTAGEANAQAAEQARALAQTLRAYGPERVRVETAISTQPLYEQYRDREGNLQTNVREDQIERYAANATVSVEVRDIALVQRIYNTVVAAKPASTSRAFFSLEPDNETKTEIYAAAVKDAARRARLATEAAGGRLGPVRAIDPTGRACDTDILAGVNTGQPDLLAPQDIVVTAQRRGAMAPPPPPPPPLPVPPVSAPGGEGVQPVAALPLDPPLQKLTARACVVYALLP